MSIKEFEGAELDAIDAKLDRRKNGMYNRRVCVALRRYSNLIRINIAANALFYAILVLDEKPSTTLVLTQVTGESGESISRALFALMAVNAVILILQCFIEKIRCHPLAFLPMFVLGCAYLVVAGVSNDLGVTPVYSMNALVLGAIALLGSVIQLDRK